jgi:hypothetical protein
LFDLEADPGESINSIGDPKYRKQLDALRADLARLFKTAGRRRSSSGHPPPVRLGPISAAVSHRH